MIHQLIKKVAATKPVAIFLAAALPPADRWLFRLTNGRYTFANLLTGLPMLILTTTGAKSGQLRTTPLVAIPVGDDLALIGSNFGQPHNPAWYYNLKANPQALVTVNGRSYPVTARELTGAEREKVWETAVSYYAGYNAYKHRASHRLIPVILLQK
jgi:deazaflavin-dependent oxidoreductase (nitroreductase family)